MDEYKNALAEFIRQELLHGRAVKLDEHQDLLSTGVVDSLGILRLVAFIESRFGLQVADEDVVFENFQSVETMAAYITQKTHTA